MCFVFFFKQKTAYEMRISDWSSDVCSSDLLAVGRYDGAQVELFMTDWEMPEAGKLPLMRGQLGTVSHEDTAFSAELRGPMHVLERPVVELLSPECRAELGDPRCRVEIGRAHV